MVWHIANVTTNQALAEFLKAHPHSTVSAIRRHIGGSQNLGDIRKQLQRLGAVCDLEGRWAFPVVEQEESLLERRKKAFARTHRKHLQDSHRTVDMGTEPYCIVHMGDPHLDDDGTDIAAIEKDLAIIASTPRMYAGCVGDITNNWVGRLQAEYAKQSSTLSEAWQLSEWYFSSAEFLYICIGNHSAWNQGDIPLQLLLKQVGAPRAGIDEQLVLDHGPDVEPLKIHIRHDFPGQSQWNPVHGHMKAAYDGDDADILVSGHRHRSGNGTSVRRDGSTAMCIQVGSYKVIDDYAIERGFRKHQITPVACTLVQPLLEGPDRVQLFWSTEEAAKALRRLQSDA